MPIDPNPDARIAAGKPLTAYFEIYHLKPDSTGEAHFEYETTVRSAEQDGRIWIKRLLAPRHQVPAVSARRDVVNVGTLRRQFVTVPVQSLPPGRYRLDVTVRDITVGTQAVRSAEFVKLPPG